VTGAENKAALPLHHLVEKLAEYHAAPPLQGFGISLLNRSRQRLKQSSRGDFRLGYCQNHREER
jgi:tryptophan synthase alpha subunit